MRCQVSSEFEVLPVCRGQGLLEGLDLLAVSSPLVFQLIRQRADSGGALGIVDRVGDGLHADGCWRSSAIRERRVGVA